MPSPRSGAASSRLQRHPARRSRRFSTAIRGACGASRRASFLPFLHEFKVIVLAPCTLCMFTKSFAQPVCVLRLRAPATYNRRLSCGAFSCRVCSAQGLHADRSAHGHHLVRVEQPPRAADLGVAVGRAARDECVVDPLVQGRAGGGRPREAGLALRGALAPPEDCLRLHTALSCVARNARAVLDTAMCLAVRRMMSATRLWRSSGRRKVSPTAASQSCSTWTPSHHTTHREASRRRICARPSS